MSALDNLIARPLPDKPLQRVIAFARDLAEGALNELWPPEFQTHRTMDEKIHWTVSRIEAKGLLNQYIQEKWKDTPPTPELLASFEYFTAGYDTNGYSSGNFTLTMKAFQLLEIPPEPASIFISYKRTESSVLALLLLQCFKEFKVSPFLDVEGIDPGDPVHSRLESQINSRQYFVCLVGKTTLDSPFVRKEIAWAVDYKREIVPIWHNGFHIVVNDYISRYPELARFLDINPICIELENPLSYDSKIKELLIHLGYNAL